MHNLLDLISENDYYNISDSSWPTFDTLKKNPTAIPGHIKNRIKEMLDQSQAELKKSEKFCALAFHGLEYRLFTPGHAGLACCGKTITELPKVQQQLINNQVPKNCQSHCFSKEGNNIASLRTIHNSMLDVLLDRDIRNLYKDSLDRTEHPKYLYKIEASNICNATCVTCGSKFSTAWQSLERKHQGKTAPMRQMTANVKGLVFDKKYHDFDEILSIDYANAKFINFFGGESTINQPNFEILEYLLEYNNTKCKISFTTHGNFNFSKDQLLLLSKFSNLHMNFSIDDIEKRFEYLRYPLSWKKLLSNIQWCREKNIEISANWTVSNLNILYYDQIKNWFNSSGIIYRVSPAFSHKLDKKSRAYHVTSLPLHIKDFIVKNNRSVEVQYLLQAGSELEQDRVGYQEFLLDITRQDLWKQICLKDYLPEFYKLIEQDYCSALDK